MPYIFKGKGAIHLIFTDIILTIAANNAQEDLDNESYKNNLDNVMNDGSDHSNTSTLVPQATVVSFEPTYLLLIKVISKITNNHSFKQYFCSRSSSICQRTFKPFSLRH